MENGNESYTGRVFQQRARRNKRKKQYQEVVENESDDDTDSTSYSIDIVKRNILKKKTSTTTTTNEQVLVDNVVDPDFLGQDNFEEYYSSTEKDNFNEHDNFLSSKDGKSPLYKDAHISVTEAVKFIMNFCNSSNFDKAKVFALMRLIKSLLPIPNQLPITFNQVLKLYGKNPSSMTKFYCNQCLTLTTCKRGEQYCTNSTCIFSNLKLSQRQLTEIITTNIREKLEYVIKKNISFFTGNIDLFPDFDVTSGSRYTFITKGIVHPITLNVFVDGAPLVRSTKSAIWPCFSSIMELPAPIREHYSNILILGLWVSCKKPDVDVFFLDIIKQITDLAENGTSIFVDGNEYQIHVKTLFFVSDLPAKSLFTKTINFNGYFACTNCITEGTLLNKQIIYPYKYNNYQSRNHEDFVTIAAGVEKSNTNAKYHSSVIGIKGLSCLLKLFRYPDDIIHDYMHLICLNHVSTLLKRFTCILTKNDIDGIDSMLSNLHLPHDAHVKYIYSIKSVNDWKAKDSRLFILNVGLPILIQHLPELYSSHFSIYCMAIKILHCPRSFEEIELADTMIHYYCKNASTIYDQKIELYSLHAHLHLPNQVLNHGAMAFTSSFCFESAIRHVKKKAHGTKHLGSQISFWYDIESIVITKKSEPPSRFLINEIKLNSSILNPYKKKLNENLNILQHDALKIQFYLRFKDKFVTYHSVLYDKRFSCNSYLVSYNDQHHQIQYGNIILFYSLENQYYSLIQQFRRTNIRISDELNIPEKFKNILDSFYPICSLNDEFIIIQAGNIRSKCISVPFKQYECISERRINYEHD
ncbi:unnamed protein product [Rotaria magnacalcarata]